MTKNVSTTLTVLGVAASLCALTACSSSGSGNNNSTTGPTSSGAPSTSTSSGSKGSSGPSIVQPSSLAPIVSQVPGLRKNISQSSCTSTKTGWAMGGTAVSPDKNRTYALQVYFTAVQGTVIGQGKGTVTVAKGKTEKWSVAGTFKAAANTRCVLVSVSEAKG